MTPTHRSYVLGMLGMLIALITTTSLVFIIADPQGIYQRTSIRGLNDVKPGFNHHEWTARAFGIENVCADAALFGSSKILHGLPASSFFEQENGVLRAYNFGIGSPSIVEISDFVRHAHSRCRLKKIVIGLDFFMFNAARLRNDKDYLRVMRTASAPYAEKLLYRFPLHAKMAFSAQGMTDAMSTIVASASGQPSPRETDWTMTSSHYEKKVRLMGGYNAIFESEAGSYIGYRPPPFYAFNPVDRSGRSYYDVFEDLVAFSTREGIELTVFISPSHAYEFIGLHVLDLWSEFEEFKRKAANIVERYAPQQIAGRCRGLIDFAYFHEFATESVPPPGSAGVMIYWWESTHYKRNVGQAIGIRIKQDDMISATNLQPFGRCLVAESISKILETERVERNLYITSHSLEVVQLYKKIRKLTTSWPHDAPKLMNPIPH